MQLNNPLLPLILYCSLLMINNKTSCLFQILGKAFVLPDLKMGNVQCPKHITAQKQPVAVAKCQERAGEILVNSVQKKEKVCET